MSQQMSFDWPTGVALGPEDFFVSEANAQAYAMVTNPESWPDRKLVITGPAGCGKSHLARIFQAQKDAITFSAKNFTASDRPNGQMIIVEDMETLGKESEETMFHLHNNLRDSGGTLLMTAKTAPSRWSITLPDLASRMQATTVVQITDPDDALLQALIMKLFADRGIAPKPELMAYLASRLERSYGTASDFVARLDELALTTGEKINRNLARLLLDKQG